ncbi:hypothetical protein AURDEDRAFT_139533 [Auricularia subglabra TFB-10046 SS5]|nr:hypothetical protein AURDEDRAFT_139533 [Auricularia subglabra TFB-10046 SS5]
MNVEPTSQDVVVEDNDPTIQYGPPGIWGQSTDKSIIDSGTTYTDTPATGALGAWAAFSFNGTRIWYFADRFNTHGNFGASIDGGPMAVYSSWNAALATGQMLYYAQLPPGGHTLNITNLDNTKVIGVDRFVYRPLGVDASPTSSIPQPDSSLGSQTQTSAPAAPKAHAALSPGAYIGIGFAAGVLALLLALSVAFCWTRRARISQPQPQWDHPMSARSDLERPQTRSWSQVVASEAPGTVTELPAYHPPTHPPHGMLRLSAVL